jgi:hypothetical protein
MSDRNPAVRRLCITITRDPESTKAAKERVTSLIEKLKQKSIQRQS